MANKRGKVTASLNAQNTFSDFLEFNPQRGNGSADFSISGTFVATVTFQRSFDGGATILDIDTTTTKKEKIYTGSKNALIRAGIKTGDFTSGPVVIEIHQEL